MTFINLWQKLSAIQELKLQNCNLSSCMSLTHNFTEMAYAYEQFCSFFSFQ